MQCVIIARNSLDNGRICFVGRVVVAVGDHRMRMMHDACSGISRPLASMPMLIIMAMTTVYIIIRSLPFR